MDRWLGDVLAEMARVTRSGGRVVVLAPSIPATAAPAALQPVERSRIRLLGTPTTVWVYHRR
jgi:ubiquinone/menaquinone biosynthesis C-methylase UbiE